MSRVVWLGLVIVATALIHAVWLVRAPVAGQVADPLLVLVIAVAVYRPAWGPPVALAAGGLQDLLFGGSLGVFALAKLLVGQGAALLARAVLVDQPFLPWVAAAAGTVLHQLVVVLVLRIGGLLPAGAADLGMPLATQVGLNLLAVWPAFLVVRLLLRRPAAPPGVREGYHGV